MQKTAICQPEFHFCHINIGSLAYDKAADIFTLFFLKGRALCRSAVARSAALDIYMLRRAFIVGIVNTVGCLAVDADGGAGMRNRALKGIHSLPFLHEALTAGLVRAACMLAAHHNIALGAQMLLIIGTILYRTF